MKVDLDKLEALAKAATPGPWFTDAADRLQGAINVMIDGHSRQVASADGQAPQFDLRDEPQKIANANAQHIAAASPDVVLELLDEVRAFRAGLSPEEAERCTCGHRHIQHLFACKARGGCACKRFVWRDA